MIYTGPVVFDDRLAEIYCGEFEGMEETPEMMKAFWQAIQTGDKGTESFHAFMKRNCDLCDLIREEHKGENVLIVTHSANARVIHYYFTGKPANYDFSKSIIKKGGLMKLEN
jgi:probable phosphoglycerate mutase